MLKRKIQSRGTALFLEEAEVHRRLAQEVPLIGANEEELGELFKWSSGNGSEQDHPDLQTYCMFIGHARSGHSLVGSLLDAHPDIAIAHELHVLRLLEAGFAERQIRRLILENSRFHARYRRRWGRYRYEVPGQWQGRYRYLRVIGDKRARESGRLFACAPELLDRLQKHIRLAIRYIHVVRNPFDNIATISIKHEKTLNEAITEYFLLCRTVRWVRREVGEESVFEMRHEDLVASPVPELARLCAFLGVSAPDEYLAACAGIVFPAPRLSRGTVAWTQSAIDRVRREGSQYNFLRRYGFYPEGITQAL